MWFEDFMKDFRRALVRSLIRQHSGDDDPSVVSITSPPWWRRIFRHKADDVIEVVSQTLPPSTPEELAAFFIDHFELAESAKDMSFTEVMTLVTKQIGADRERMASKTREITQRGRRGGRTLLQQRIESTATDPMQPPPGPVPFGKASECVSCKSKYITGDFVQEGFKNHCATCGHTWIGEWPSPVVTSPPKADAGASLTDVKFLITTGPGLEKRATKILASLNRVRKEGRRHTGHWEAFYYHDDVCPSQDSKTKCTCRQLVVKCYPISDEKAAKMRADDTKYDNYTVMET